MSILMRNLLGRLYREEAGSDGDAGGGANTTAPKPADTGTGDGATGDGDNTGGDAGDTGDNSSEGGDSSSSDETGDNEAGNEGDSSVPDTYADFTLPDEMSIDKAALEASTPLFKELGLSQEAAQKVVSHYAELIKASSEKQNSEFNQLKQDWLTSAKGDKEVGGDGFDKNVNIARASIDKLGTPELKQLLDDYGIGNHPEIIRYAFRVSNALGLKEDNPGGDSGNPSNPAQDRVSQLYGNSNK